MRRFRLFLPALLLASAGLVPAQRYTDPDTLAPAFPTPQGVVDHMLEMAGLKPGETLYDLGCGDGRIVITAAQKFKAKAVGVEIRRDIYESTLGRVRSLGLTDSVQIIHGNALKTDISQADVVTLYLLTSSNDRLKPVLETMKPGARVVSHDFEIRDWKPITTERMMVGTRPHMVYVYQIKGK